MPFTILLINYRMVFYAHARSSILSWVHGTPLPSVDRAYLKFQSWHHFDPIEKWIPTRSTANTSAYAAEPTRGHDQPNLVLLTWNIDATSSRTQERDTDIITLITRRDPPVDIIFLQEVSKLALQQILQDERIRGSWFSSERDNEAWGNQPFCNDDLTVQGTLCIAL